MLLNAPSLLTASPFYSVILGLRGTTDSSHLPLLGTRTNVVSATLVISPFCISHNFLLLVFLPQKSPADFPLWGVFKELRPFFLQGLSPFSDSTFGCFSSCHFSQVSWFLLARLEVFPTASLHGSSFWVPQGTGPLLTNCCFPSFRVFFFFFFFCIIGWLIETYLLSFLVFLGTPFELSWSHPGFVAHPEYPEPLVVLGYPGLILTTGLPSDFLTLADWTSFLLPFVSWILRPIYSWVWVLP